ncbi:MAG: hypothetical protein CMO81_05235 [Waddliaceae bacterium]|nr:hypothetical protein [Waddliaceae bacterium]|tara:strand:- start:68 stop:496 length:429 start_codon:yes stop_codon:yes gene_type:complete
MNVDFWDTLSRCCENGQYVTIHDDGSIGTVAKKKYAQDGEGARLGSKRIVELAKSTLEEAKKEPTEGEENSLEGRISVLEAMSDGLKELLPHVKACIPVITSCFRNIARSKEIADLIAQAEDLSGNLKKKQVELKSEDSNVA